MSKLILSTAQKFQSFALNRCRVRGILTPEKMLRHFTIETIVKSIAVNNERRADLVVKCVGTKRNSALKQDVEDSRRAIELALEVGDTNAEEIFDEKGDPAGASTDEIAFYLPGDKVFDLWFNAGWPGGDSDDKAFMANMWEFILEHKMFGDSTHLQLVMELGPAFFVADKIPHALRTSVLGAVLKNGEPLLHKSDGEGSSVLIADKGRAFTAKDLLDMMPPSALVEYLELSDMARPIAVLAKTNGWMKMPPASVSLPPPPAAVETASEPPPAPSDDDPKIIRDDASLEDLTAEEAAEAVEELKTIPPPEAPKEGGGPPDLPNKKKGVGK